MALTSSWRCLISTRSSSSLQDWLRAWETTSEGAETVLILMKRSWKRLVMLRAFQNIGSLSNLTPEATHEHVLPIMNPRGVAILGQNGTPVAVPSVRSS